MTEKTVDAICFGPTYNIIDGYYCSFKNRKIFRIL